MFCIRTVRSSNYIPLVWFLCTNAVLRPHEPTDKSWIRWDLFDNHGNYRNVFALWHPVWSVGICLLLCVSICGIGSSFFLMTVNGWWIHLCLSVASCGYLSDLIMVWMVSYSALPILSPMSKCGFVAYPSNQQCCSNVRLSSWMVLVQVYDLDQSLRLSIWGIVVVNQWPMSFYDTSHFKNQGTMLFSF